MLFKKIITILLVTFLFTACKDKQSTSSNQDVKNNNTENNDASPKDLLVNTWKVTGDQYDVTKEMEDNFNHISVEFAKDGKVTVKGEKGATGTYKISDDGKSFTIFDDDGYMRSNEKEFHFEILMLTKNKLKVVTTALDKPAHTFTLESK